MVGGEGDQQMMVMGSNLNEGLLKTCQPKKPKRCDSSKSFTCIKGFLRFVEIYPQSFRPFESAGYF